MTAPAITPLVLRTQLENLIGDTFDVTHTYQLLTQAKNHIETTLKLAVLQAYDSSQTASPGDTYLTLKSLPSDFKSMNKLVLSNGSTTTTYYPIPMSKREMMQKVARRYYIDYKRMVQGSTALGLCGSIGTAQTIGMHYQASTPALTEVNEGTTGVVLWPDEFQPIIAYQAAKIIQANTDADEINFRMSKEQEAEYQRLLDALIAWDHEIKLSEMGNQRGYADEVMDGEAGFDVGLL
ncbi:MAG: hypothetical protein RBG13Loki_0388 [Promethearchaeota archaeon CR_4]|nr:MAG: hypothetical protein RBG13Loki_0388 [Candidatus Lokiarchaeota archaeon CR_4]